MSASSAAIALRFVTAKSAEGGWNLVMKSERVTALSVSRSLLLTCTVDIMVLAGYQSALRREYQKGFLLFFEQVERLLFLPV